MTGPTPEDDTPSDFTSQISKTLKVGSSCNSGSFGTIYRRTIESSEGTIEVAVKVFKIDPGRPMERIEKGIRREIKVESPFPALVSRWMSSGTLYMYLEQGIVTAPAKVELVMGVADGLNYLHSENVVHGDLHPANVLIDGSGNPRLTDFGLATVVGNVELQLNSTTAERSFNHRWRAPEVIGIERDPERPTFKSDIYSFGGVMFFIISGDVPWKEKKHSHQITIELSKGAIHARPNKILNDHWNLIQKCWSWDPVDRPGAAEVYGNIAPKNATIIESGAGKSSVKKKVNPSYDTKMVEFINGPAYAQGSTQYTALIWPSSSFNIRTTHIPQQELASASAKRRHGSSLRPVPLVGTHDPASHAPALETIYPTPMRPAPGHSVNVSQDGWIPRADPQRSFITIPLPHETIQPMAPSTRSNELDNHPRHNSLYDARDPNYALVRTRDYAYAQPAPIHVPRPRSPPIVSRSLAHIPQYELVNVPARRQHGNALRREMPSAHTRSGSQPERHTSSRSGYGRERGRKEDLVERWRTDPEVFATAAPGTAQRKPPGSYRPRESTMRAPPADSRLSSRVESHTSQVTPPKGSPPRSRNPLDYFRQRFQRRSHSPDSIPDITVEPPSDDSSSSSDSVPDITVEPPSDDSSTSSEYTHHSHLDAPRPLPLSHEERSQTSKRHPQDSQSPYRSTMPVKPQWPAGFIPMPGAPLLRSIPLFPDQDG